MERGCARESQHSLHIARDRRVERRRRARHCRAPAAGQHHPRIVSANARSAAPAVAVTGIDSRLAAAGPDSARALSATRRRPAVEPEWRRTGPRTGMGQVGMKDAAPRCRDRLRVGRERGGSRGFSTTARWSGAAAGRAPTTFASRASCGAGRPAPAPGAREDEAGSAIATATAPPTIPPAHGSGSHRMRGATLPAEMSAPRHYQTFSGAPRDYAAPRRRRAGSDVYIGARASRPRPPRSRRPWLRRARRERPSPRGEHPGGALTDRAVEQLDQLEHGDLGRRLRERVPALDPALGAEESSSAKRGEQLLEELRRDLATPRELAIGTGPRSPWPHSSTNAASATGS